MISIRIKLVALIDHFACVATDKVYNLPSTRLRDTIRAEYINTNYSVVNPRTLDAVSFHEVFLWQD